MQHIFIIESIDMTLCVISFLVTTLRSFEYYEWTLKDASLFDVKDKKIAF